MTPTRVRDARTSTVCSKDGTVIAYHSLGHGPGLVVVGGALSAGSDYMALAAAYRTQGRPDKEFLYYSMSARAQAGPTEAGQSVQQLALTMADSAADSTSLWLSKAGNKISWVEKLESVNTLAAFYDDTQRPRPESLTRMMPALYKKAATAFLENARGEKDPALKARDLEWAKSYARAIHDSKTRKEIKNTQAQQQ